MADDEAAGLMYREEFASEHFDDAIQYDPARLSLFKRECLGVFLPTRRFNRANDRRDGLTTKLVRHANGPFMHRREAGLRSRLSGQLRVQAGDHWVHQPVQPGGAQFGQPDQGHSQGMQVNREVIAVEARAADELAVEKRGRIRHSPERARDRPVQRVDRAVEVREHLGRRSERDRRLQRVRTGLRATQVAQSLGDPGEDIVATGKPGVEHIARRAGDRELGGQDGQRVPQDLPGVRGREHGKRRGHRDALDQRHPLLGAKPQRHETGLRQRLSRWDRPSSRPAGQHIARARQRRAEMREAHDFARHAGRPARNCGQHAECDRFR